MQQKGQVPEMNLYKLRDLHTYTTERWMWTKLENNLRNKTRIFTNIKLSLGRPDDGGSTYIWNVGRHSIKNTAVHTRRFWASYSPPWELEISH
jgi:hypothetical protein